jgi:hypothetical protein
MQDKDFDTNLLRFIAAETYVLVSMQVSREMFGKGYFSLSASEKAAVDQTTNTAIGGNYQSLTPQFLGVQPKNPVGFQVPQDGQKVESDKK